MPQELQVVQCFSCSTFQVEIVKKSKKWECKICNIKQSFKQIFFKGTGKDCRLYVQKLNEMRMTNDLKLNEDNLEYRSDSTDLTHSILSVSNTSTHESKWSKYLEKPDSNIVPAINDDNENIHYTLEMPRKKRRMNNSDKQYSQKKKSHYNKYKQTSEKTSCIDETVTSEVNTLSNITTIGFIKEDREPETEIQHAESTIGLKVSYKPPSISATSKWSKFIKNEPDSIKFNEEEVILKNTNNCEHILDCEKKTNNLFNLSFDDESNLDDILDF